MTEKIEVSQKIKRRNKWLEISAWALATVILIAALVYYNFLAKEREMTVYGVGDKCPAFTAMTYEGETKGEFSLVNTTGKVVVLNFWAVWCDPCKKELPYFNELQENYSEEVVVVAFHQIGYKYEEVQSLINEKRWDNYSLIFAQDDNLLGQGTAPLYDSLGGKNVWPMTVVLDKQGRINSVRQGGMEYSELEEMFLEALNK